MRPLRENGDILVNECLIIVFFNEIFFKIHFLFAKQVLIILSEVTYLSGILK